MSTGSPDSTSAQLPQPDATHHPNAVRHRSAGAIVFKDGQVLILRKVNGEWVFPKGHIEPREKSRATARREVLEESGVQADIGEYLGTTSYIYSGSRQLEHRKRVDWFIATWRAREPRPEPGFFQEARWAEPGEAAKLLTFEEDRDILAQSLKLRP